MSVDEIIKEIRSLRQGVEQTVQRIAELSLTLYSRARRRQLAVSGEPEPEDPSPYIVYSNGWARMASSLRQGMQRMDRTDRMFGQRTTKAEAETPKPVAPPVVAPPRVTDDSMEELVALYGGEIVNDAIPR